jgi:hypothetical protein
VFTAYVCRDYACGLPTGLDEFKRLAEELEKRPAAD